MAADGDYGVGRLLGDAESQICGPVEFFHLPRANSLAYRFLSRSAWYAYNTAMTYSSIRFAHQPRAWWAASEPSEAMPIKVRDS